MTSKQNTQRLLRREKAAYIGLYENIWPDTLALWEKSGYPKGIPPEQYFHYDINRIGKTFDTLPLPGVREVLEETDDWRVERNGAGAVLRQWKHKSGTPEHIGFHMASREIWEREYRSHLLNLDPARFDFDGTRKAWGPLREQGLWVCFNSVCLWETMRQSMGDLCMYESLALDPDWIRDFNAVYTSFYIQHYRALFDAAGVPDGIWLSEDFGYKNGLFCSVSMLEDLFGPYYKQIVDFFHSYQIPVILHSCGQIEKAIPFFIEMGFDALHPMERKAGCDPLRFAQQYGDKLAFIGGLDARILENGDHAQIKTEVERLMKGMKSIGASYFFASDHSLSTLVSLDAYQYALQIYDENRDL